GLRVEWVRPGQTSWEELPRELLFYQPVRAMAGVPRAGARLLCAERSDQLDYFRPDSLARPYVTRWRARQMGHPSELAPLVCSWDGALQLPESPSGTVTLRVESSGEVMIRAGEVSFSKTAQKDSATAQLPAHGQIVTFHLEARDPGLIRRLIVRWQC